MKFTLCLDEFPYLAKSSPELPALLQKLIDAKSLKYNIIICGSSQQLMPGLVLDATSPLYGRADQILKLMPIGVVFPDIGKSACKAVMEKLTRQFNAYVSWHWEELCRFYS